MGATLYFTAEDRGSINVFMATLTGGVKAVTTGAQVLSLGSLAKNGMAAVTRATPLEPPDVYRIDLRRAGSPVRLTARQ